MNDKLRECPLCNKTESVQWDDYDGIYYILCNAKNGGCGTTSGGYENKEEALELWNTRHEPKHETVEQWEDRIGETYPDDAPLWWWNGDNSRYQLTTYEWLKEYIDFMPLKDVIKIVATPHGKPEEAKC